MTEEQTRARLWEDTIVISLRDVQWLRSLERHAKHSDKAQIVKPAPMRPQGFIKFDGRAESHLGDVALGLGDRYFIIEVKPTFRNIHSEWLKDGHFKPKKVYSRLRTLISEWRMDDVEDEVTKEAQLLMSSFRGHFIAYWGVTAPDKPPAVVLTPYLDAIVQSHKPHPLRNPNMITHHPLPGVKPTTMQGDPITSIDLGRNDCVLQWPDPYGNGWRHDKKSLGLSADEFQLYVNYLCEDADHDEDSDPINAVMLSSRGTFFQVARRTSDLALILSERFEHRVYQQPRPTPQHQPENDVENDSPGP